MSVTRKILTLPNAAPYLQILKSYVYGNHLLTNDLFPEMFPVLRRGSIIFIKREDATTKETAKMAEIAMHVVNNGKP